MSTPSAHVNGAPYPLGPAGAVPVTDVVRAVVPGFVTDGAPRGVAVAIDDVVVPRGTWDAVVVRAGDRVEILTAVQGG
jgi:sulfur carrier protein